VVYNFWQDPEHERGIWRRTLLATYRTGDPAWETVLDIDALNQAEGKQWVFKGSECLPPAYARCLVSLSRGGGDAVEIREFDTITKAFVPGGFLVPEAKNNVSWRDVDTLWLGTDFGPGSLTTSGYARIVKQWRRGTPMAEARTVFEGKVEDMTAAGNTIFTPEGSYDVVVRVPAFFQAETYLVLAAAWSRSTSRSMPRCAGFSRNTCWCRCAPTGPSAARRTGRARCSASRSTTSSRVSAPSRWCSSRRHGSRSPGSRRRASTW